MNKFHPFLGALIIAFIFLVPWLRNYAPRSAESFNFFILLLLFLSFFFLSLWSIYVLFRKNMGSPWPLWLQGLTGSPARFHGWLILNLPQPSWWTRFRWNLIQYLSPLSWPSFFISYFLSFLSLIPPLVLILEFFFQGKIHLFYFSLLFLSIPLVFRLLSYHLDHFSLWVQSIQEKEFSVREEEGQYLFSFHQEDSLALAKIANWNIFFAFRQKLSFLENLLGRLAPYLFLLRSLLYFLAWSQILFKHSFFALFPLF